MNLEGIDHVAMAVRDVEAAAQWYIDVLGFEPLYPGQWDGGPTFVGKGTTGIALFPMKGGPTEPGKKHASGTKFLHLAFRADARNFQIAQEELKQRSIPFDFQDHEISHSIYFQDPDGHELEITTYDLTES
jgi:catechol 2,3-dioxygenase-like lactoylglutathione lyase family enzyme